MVNVNERKKTRKFYDELEKRSQEAKEHPEECVPLEDILKRYPLNQQTDNEPEVDGEKHPPEHCPNCGSTNIHNQELESGHQFSELYDTYCRDCKWSGDISPDVQLSKSPKHKTEKKERS